MRILIIEDEHAMAEAVRYSFEKEGFEVDIANDGETGRSMLARGAYDLVLLDLMLPGVDGIEICKEVVRERSTPIIMITARDSEVDKVLGLELGADDYLTKPFSMRELVARARAVLRRSSGQHPREGAVLEAGDVVVDPERHEVKVRGEVVELPLIEYRILELFVKNRGRVLTREQLIARGWEGDFYSQSKTLDVHIHRLRDKVEPDPSSPCRIITVRGIGYRFEPS